MKIILLVFVISFSNHVFATSLLSNLLKHSPPPPTGPSRSLTEVSTDYFTQKLDHLDPDNTQTWYQRYFVNTDYFNSTSNNVAFLMLGGESSLSSSWMVRGSWVDSAKKYGALLFQLEHRYYGYSLPVGNYSMENLRYLSSEQALADAANFIKSMNANYSLAPDVKWIVYGGSYAGGLAAWLRLKYPDLVQGAVSASGTLFAKLDFSEYNQLVIDDLAGHSEGCVNSLKAAMGQVDDLLLNPSPEENLTSIFNLCVSIEGFESNHVDVQTLYMGITSALAMSAQYDGISRLIGINYLCDVLTDERRGKEIFRLAYLMTSTYGNSCIDTTYKKEVDSLRDITAEGHRDGRQWIYQTCNEYGWYQTSNREDNLLGTGCPVEYYTQLCADVYSPQFDTSYIKDRIEQTNANYGGVGINVSNVVHVHGSYDPWRAVGLTETTNPDSPVIIIEGIGHCAIMYEFKTGELPQLTEAREEVDRLRYYVNTEFFDTGARNVAFLYIGGEFPVSSEWMESGTWIDNAKKYSAVLFQPEHRYYGVSAPLPDYSTENLRFLSIDQALADLARFVRAMNDKYSLASDVKWIAYGASYSASLATWLRSKYPDLVQGAVAASAPLLAKLNFSEYYQKVIDDLDATNKKCVDSIKTAMAQVEDLFIDSNPVENITAMFNMCKPIEASDLDNVDFKIFTRSLTTVFGVAAQFDDELSVRADDVCDIMTDEDRGKEIYRLADAVQLLYGLVQCSLSNYADYVDWIKNITVDEMKVERQWIYQSCTEFGWYQTSDTKDRVFGEGCSAEFLQKLCVDTFGPEFNITFNNERIELMNAKYGGADISVTNVVSVHGDRDPWHSLGHLKENNPEFPVIIIEGTTHCAVIYNDDVEDESPQMTAAKEKN
ncbi:hypothetical protein NQ315_000831 [Exocentrus adspersus]|uniref:Serine protease K12H4.7 n=1 Tax=Exocentrus adspersus TaxID=1586481 RepID=A0AAV8WF20_9CUCU|nr:hypothetical protein NQ315_000831 [Exocentrus adspersus]